jgi:hypothetical protein
VAGNCGIPATAQAVSANFAVTNTTGNGFISVWPGGQPQPVPLVASMNFSAGQTIANAVLVPLGGGGINVFARVTTDLIIDVNGYFEAGVVLANQNCGAQVVKGFDPMGNVLCGDASPPFATPPWMCRPKTVNCFASSPYSFEPRWKRSVGNMRCSRPLWKRCAPPPATASFRRSQATTMASRTPLGAFFSFSGHFLHPRKSAVLDVFRQLPHDRILLETDAPDMLPPGEFITHPLPENHNHPGNLPAIGMGLAAALGMKPEDFAGLTCGNARRCFGF